MPNSLRHALDIALASDTGRVREHNEDAVFADADLGLVLLADGMGGYNAGEVASSLAIMHLSSRIALSLAERNARDCLLDGIESANTAILQAAASHPECAGMGTTLVAALFFNNRAMVAHVGDSRCYRLRDDDLLQLTRDHSLVQEMLDRGEITATDALFAPSRHVLTRALGVEPNVQTEVTEYDARIGDLFLLCSDGLTDMLSEHEIKQALQKHGETGLAALARQLVALANEQGGRDNISLILIGIAAEFGADAAIGRQPEPATRFS